MELIYDFDEWFDLIELEDYEDVNSLYRSVEECDEYGRFNTQEAKGEDNGWIVSELDLDQALHLKSNKAREYFLRTIEDKYCEGMNMEGWYDYHHQMDKDD